MGDIQPLAVWGTAPICGSPVREPTVMGPQCRSPLLWVPSAVLSGLLMLMNGQKWSLTSTWSLNAGNLTCCLQRHLLCELCCVRMVGCVCYHEIAALESLPSASVCRYDMHTFGAHPIRRGFTAFNQSRNP